MDTDIKNQNKHDEIKVNSNKLIRFEGKQRLFVFLCLTAMNILFNMDHGTIPASSNEIKRDLHIKETELGTFGSLVYLGTLIGALLLTRLIDVVDRKMLTIITTMFSAVLLYTFTKVTTLWFLFLNRIFVGIAQSFIAIYFPVWIDQFGQRSWKTIMLSVFNVTSPIGVIFGYIITMLIKVDFDWRVSYLIQVILLVICALAAISCDDILFSKNIHLMKNKRGDDNQNDLESHMSTSKNTDAESVFIEIDEQDHHSSIDKYYQIIKNPVYLFSCLSITTMLFVSTAVIFWTSDFCLNVLNGTHHQVLLLISVVCVTGPVVGVVLGGVIVQKFAKGYEGKHSIAFSFVFALLSVISSIPIRMISDLTSFGICLWSILFFGGMAIPSIQGIMISSLSKELRASGNSISNILQNLLGFIPAPFVYGVIYENTKSNDPKLAMTLCLGYSMLGVIFVGIAMFFRYKNWKINKRNERNSSYLKNDLSNEDDCLIKKDEAI